ncbi:MAG: hypothetical protein ACOX4Y_00665 [Limnochordia bacterium]|jgi:hypothetical protein
MTEIKRYYALFAAANLVTFTFIALLQIAKGWLFVAFLAAMHSGIALFIMAKRRMLALNQSLKRFFDRVFFYLALYIPLLLYKGAGYLFPQHYNETMARIAMLAVIAFSAAASLCNAVRLHRFMFGENLT